MQFQFYCIIEFANFLKRGTCHFPTLKKTNIIVTIAVFILVTPFKAILCPARSSLLEPKGWNCPLLSTKFHSPFCNWAKSHASNSHIAFRVEGVTCEVAIKALHWRVFHESPRIHPVDQLQIVAVEPHIQRTFLAAQDFAKFVFRRNQRMTVSWLARLNPRNQKNAERRLHAQWWGHDSLPCHDVH